MNQNEQRAELERELPLPWKVVHPPGSHSISAANGEGFFVALGYEECVALCDIVNNSALTQPAPDEGQCAKVLRELEYVDCEGYTNCPICSMPKGLSEKHEPGCELAAALASAPASQETSAGFDEWWSSHPEHDLEIKHAGSSGKSIARRAWAASHPQASQDKTPHILVSDIFMKQLQESPSQPVTIRISQPNENGQCELVATSHQCPNPQAPGDEVVRAADYACASYKEASGVYVGDGERMAVLDAAMEMLREAVDAALARHAAPAELKAEELNRQANASHESVRDQSCLASPTPEAALREALVIRACNFYAYHWYADASNKFGPAVIAKCIRDANDNGLLVTPSSGGIPTAEAAPREATCKWNQTWLGGDSYEYESDCNTYSFEVRKSGRCYCGKRIEVISTPPTGGTKP